MDRSVSQGRHTQGILSLDRLGRLDRLDRLDRLVPDKQDILKQDKRSLGTPALDTPVLGRKAVR